MMVHRIHVAYGSVLAWLILVSSAQSQLVVVRPGYIRAPFVRVIRRADGSTTVRAPFVRINSRPPFRARVRPEPLRVGPLAKTTKGTLSDKPIDLRRAILESRLDLDNDLKKLPTGAVWRNFFLTRQAIVNAKGKGEATPDERARIEKLLSIFDQAADNADLKAITNLESFRSLHAAMHEFVLSPLARLQRRIDYHAEDLQKPAHADSAIATVAVVLEGSLDRFRSTRLDCD